jgi:beta-N-acetylhexosaminidase
VLNLTEVDWRSLLHPLLSAIAAAVLSLPAPSGGMAANSGSSSAKLLGQRIMVGFSGTTAPPALLRRVRAGQVGAVILFGANIASDRQVRGLTSALQSAARSGGNPPLLIATDQEGGQVKRFPGGPPSLSPPQMAATGSPHSAYLQGKMTGAYLKSRGVNMDLAPVADVPTSSGSFIWRQGRAFSFTSSTVAKYATAFALGLQSAGVAATAKHFPGLGSAAVSTDLQRDELHPSAAQRAAALKPYESLIPRGLDAVMVTTAGFPAYDPSGAPAALSSRIVGGVLRRQLGFGGLVITDALNAPTGHSEIIAGTLAARAGADMLLYADSATGELGALESALKAGRISRTAAVASYERIVALKQKLSG